MSQTNSRRSGSQSNPRQTDELDPARIAIVGVGGVFPGCGVETALEDFWHLIRDGRSAASEPPEARWNLDVDTAYHSERATPDRVHSRRACFVTETVSAPEAFAARLDSDSTDSLDPMVHFLLKAAEGALSDIDLSAIDPERVGAIFGNIVLPTEASSAISRSTWGRAFLEQVIDGTSADSPLLSEDLLSEDTDPRGRFVAGLPASLLARAIGIRGGAFTLDAACASSLYALRFATDELRSGRADLMLAGGLSRPDPLYTQMGFSQLRAVSPTGTCRPFDPAGNGLVVGEGAGLFALARLEDAIRWELPIWGVIQGIGVSNDRRGSLLAPDSEGQLRAIRQAYREAGWDPRDVDLFECHATGTPLGDQVEVDSLSQLLAEAEAQSSNAAGHDSDPVTRAFPAVVGSVKSNVGHLLTAAGAAGLTKALLALRHETLPPTAGFETPLPGLEASPLRALSTAQPWPDPDRPRRAAVSAFGFGGINAHVLIEEWREEDRANALKSTAPATEEKLPSSEPIAIVGYSIRTPNSDGLSDFLSSLTDVNSPPPALIERYATQRAKTFSSLSGVAGFAFEEISIPIGRFRIPPAELREMLPQQLLLLNTAADAIDHAIHSDSRLVGADPTWLEGEAETTGVFIGIGLDMNATNFSVRWGLEASRHDSETAEAVLSTDLVDRATPALSANRTMGALGGIVASRVAREFRLGGPSFTVSSEECSGSQALELAVAQLREGRLSMAIAGAVDLGADPRAALGAAAQEPWATADQVSRALDVESAGARPGEGAIVFVLKRLDDAERDGDTVHAIVRGVGSSAAGAPERRLDLAYERALGDAGLTGDDLDLIELHGSGSPAEDAEERSSIERWTSPREASDRLALASAKDRYGHLGAASGLLGVAHACAALATHSLPRDPETGTPCRYWLHNSNRGPRRVGVNTLGREGGAHHLVLEAPARTPEPSPTTSTPGVFIWRAETATDLLSEVRSIAEALHGRDAPHSAANHPGTHPGTYGHGPACLAVVATDSEELASALRQAVLHLETQSEAAYNEDATRRGPAWFYRPTPLQGELAFVFPGSGNQFQDMARELALAWPQVLARQELETSDLAAQWHAETFWSLPSESTEAAESDLNHPVASLFGHVTVGVFMHDLLREFGIDPDAVIGYSLGETTSLFATRTWTERDEMLDRMRRTSLFHEELSGRCLAARRALGVSSDAPFEWSLGVVARSAEAVRHELVRHPGAYLLIVNTPHECVVGGEASAVQGLVTALDTTFHSLHGVTTVHCEVADSVADDYRDLHRLKTTPPESTRIYSVARGEAHGVTSQSAAESITRQAVEGFDFPRTIRQAYADGVRHFLEVGPGRSTSRMIERILEEEPNSEFWTRSAAPNTRNSVGAFLGVVAELATLGIPVRIPSDGATPADPNTTQRITIPVGDDWKSLPRLTPPIQVTDPTRTRESLRVPPFESATATSNPSLETPAAARFETPNVEAKRFALSSAQLSSSPPSSTPQSSNPQGSNPKRPAAHNPTGPNSVPPRPIASRSELTEWAEAEGQAATAHARFLELSYDRTETLARWIGQLSNPQPSQSATESRPSDLEFPEDEFPDDARDAEVPAGSPERADRPYTDRPYADRPYLDRDQCMEIAIGSIAKVLGPEFSEVDTFPTRVRLPDEPLMLVDRILEIEGSPRSLESGRIVTEHDVGARPWYLDGGRIPTSIAVEAGQADLFLSGYLGIDFHTRGEAVYRLLDAEVTFHSDLPPAGAVIHYDIHIDHFFFQGDTALFRFYFDATVNGEPLLTMRNGCAGFFTQAELDAGQGIVRPRQQPALPTMQRAPSDFAFVDFDREESLDDSQVARLYQGDLAGSLGPAFRDVPLAEPLTLPGGHLTLVHRVLSLTPNGGRHGRGQIRAEMDIHPDDWFLTCHFSDDQVMPGTLMYECCLHTLRIFLLRMGWIGESRSTWTQPIPGQKSRLKCRGQVIETTRKVVYEIDIKELGFGPEPFAVTDALMYADGRPVVEIGDMSIQFRGLSESDLQKLWTGNSSSSSSTMTASIARPALFDDDRILAFATGRPSDAFGEPYRIFDEERRIARLPGPPYKFLDRVVSIENAEPFVLEAGARIEAQYDVPSDEWYFGANRAEEMAFAILLEIALQPCGWLAGYLGSALTSTNDLKFRNLGGTGTLHRPVTAQSGTLTIAVSMTSVSQSGDMIIQHFDFSVSDRHGVVYDGKTYFGFFSAAALANQVGIRDATPYEPSPAERQRAQSYPYPKAAPFPEAKLRMIEHVSLAIPDGGPSGLGFYQGTKPVDPDEWFFAAHFYQDPVCPGSLGLEAFLQLLKLAVHDRFQLDDRWGDRPIDWNLKPSAQHEWVYRGQYIPRDSEVTVQAWITEVDEERHEVTGSGYLSVDGRMIYRMDDFRLSATRTDGGAS